MKRNLTFLALLITFGPFSLAYSQGEFEPIWGATGKVTATFTETWSDPTLFQKDETGILVYQLNEETGKNEKIPTTTNNYTVEILQSGNPIKSIETTEFGRKNVTYRYGNREILMELKNSGALGEDVTSISGWSIVGYYEGLSFNASVIESNARLVPRFFVRHTDKRIIDLTDMLVTIDPANLMTTTSMKVSLTTDFRDEFGTPQASNSYSSSYKGTAAVTVQTGGAVTGIVTGKESLLSKTYTYYDIDPEDETGEKLIKYTDRSILRVPGSVKLEKLVGTMAYENGSSLLEGTITVSTPTVVNGELYLAGPEEVIEEF